MPTVPAIRAGTDPDMASLPSASSRLDLSLEPQDQILPTLVSDSALPVYPQRTDLPIVFPGYETHGEIGRGGMGVVYRARQRSLNRPVALKVILAGPHASDADRARFRLEAEAGARLKHPNIVQVYDVGEHGGFAYIAFELIEGQTLRLWQGNKPADPEAAARIIADLARGVQNAHEHGIIHRDIKPANVLMSPRECDSKTSLEWRKAHRSAPPSASISGTRDALPIPKLTDFGLAKKIEGGADLTITGMACGTPHYMSPEQVRGKAVGPTADVYGLGAVLYELLTGRPPFKGTDAAQVMEKILRSDPERVRRVNPDVPRDLEVITTKCLEKDPSRRYASPAALVEDLERFLGGRPITARPVSLTERTWRWCKRNPVVTVFLVLSTAACIATGNLALALARSVSVEREARAEAEQARDDLRIALGKEEIAHRKADLEKEAADKANLEAIAARKQADLEKIATAQQRDRANGHLRLARMLIRNTFHDVNGIELLRGPEFIGFRASLLKSADAFFKEFSPHASNDPEALDELSDCAHMMGYLEFLNGDNNASAAHYITAAEVAARWVQAAPQDPESKLRQAWALQNAAIALFHARRHDEAEKRFREAITLFTEVAEQHPKNELYLKRLVQAYPPLCELLRDRQRWADGADVSRKYLDRTNELARRGGMSPKVESIQFLIRANQCLGQMLDRGGKADEGETFLVEAAGLREQIQLLPGTPQAVAAEMEADAGRAHFALAQHYVLIVKRPEKAPAPIERSIQRLELALKLQPATYEYQVDLAESCHLAATIFQQDRTSDRAEHYYDRAIGITEPLLAGGPKPSTSANARRVWVAAMTGRAHFYNAAGRHKDAITQWSRLAVDDPDPAGRLRAALFVLQSKTFAGEWREVVGGIEKLAAANPPPWLLIDLAKVWCRVGKLAGEDSKLSNDARTTERDRAFDRAVDLLEKAKKAGAFNDPDVLKYFETSPEFDPIRNRFKPRD